MIRVLIILALAPACLARDFSVQHPRMTRVGAEQHLRLLDAKGPLDLRLAPVNLRGPNFRVSVVGEGGVEREVAAPPPRTWAGRVEGQPRSRVAATLQGGAIRAEAWLEDGRVLAVEPHGGLHRVFDPEETPADPGGCACAEHDFPLHAAEDGGADSGGGELLLPPAQVGAATIFIAEVAIDTDFEYFQMQGSSVSNVVADVEDLLNRINNAYDNMDIRWVLSEIKVRSTPDDPYSTSDPNQLITQLRDHWNTEHADVPRDTVHLLTARPMNGQNIGNAFLGALCIRSFAYGYAKTNFSGNSTRRAAVSAHELGHNFGAGHCDGAADCGIMCSRVGNCPGPIQAFGAAASAQIIATRDSAACLEQVSTLSPPLAKDDVFLVAPGSTNRFAVLFNDIEPDESAMSIVTNTVPANGSAIAQADETIQFVPDPGFLGEQTFTYEVTDNVHGSDTGTVSVFVGAGIHYEYYEATSSWTVLPDFDGEIAVDAGLIADFDITPNREGFIYGFRFRTRLAVPADDTYTFFLQSRDGSKLLLDGELVVDNDGQNNASEVSAVTNLFKGLYDLEVQYFQRAGPRNLAVRWSSGGFAKQPLPTASLLLIPPHTEPPVVAGEVVTTLVNQAVSVAVLDNDSDPEGEVIHLEGVGTPTNGVSAFTRTNVTYTPNGGFDGLDAFTYLVEDTGGGIATGVVQVIVDIDTDNDGLGNRADPNDDDDLHTDEEEGITGSDPLDANSLFTVDITTNLPPRVSFFGLAGRLYQLQVRSNLVTDVFADLGAELTGQDAPIGIPVNGSNAHFRVGVRLAP